ncbi:hypothetical protein RDV64_07900 [Acuticoccus sp. MNP-M23]|uniref:hypothetical protein n=1 Tax=Acuticoccus sp. MNP-M23 TaxID=3072793 RepID=UPI0028155DDE|nr:hypothetical protein [Acuticoccus sp. MNP-M23]WMS44301.1 hypothetical protein RDV64_07900 [Acuticoccus sp. MNP-M23]
MVGRNENGQGAGESAPWHRHEGTEIFNAGQPLGRKRGAVELADRPLTRLAPTPLKRRGRCANGVPRYYPKSSEPGPWMRRRALAASPQLPRKRASLTPRTL